MAARPKAKSGSAKLSIRTLVSNEPGFARAFDALVRRSTASRDEILSAAEKIVAKVREGGGPDHQEKLFARAAVTFTLMNAALPEVAL